MLQSLNTDASSAAESRTQQLGSPQSRDPAVRHPAITSAGFAPAHPCVPIAAPPAFSIEWAAGFADGEGCIHVAKQTYKDAARKTTYRLRLCIEQNDREVLEHFRAGLGAHGVIYTKKRELGHNKQVYRLNYDGKHALQAIAALLPMLVRKRTEAIIALAFWTQGEAGRHFGPRGLPAHVAAIRERLYRKLRSLK